MASETEPIEMTPEEAARIAASHYGVTENLLERAFNRLFDRKLYPCIDNKHGQGECIKGSHLKVHPDSLCDVCKAYWLTGAAIRALHAAEKGLPAFRVANNDHQGIAEIQRGKDGYTIIASIPLPKHV